MARAGEYISNLSGEAEYKSFRPTPLPVEINIDTEMLSLLTDATKSLATLDTLSSYIPNMELFVSMYVRKEALLSSQIEGTQATLEDVLDPLIEKNANQNVSDVYKGNGICVKSYENASFVQQAYKGNSRSFDE